MTMKSKTTTLRIALVAPTNSMVVRRAALFAVRHTASLDRLNLIPHQEFSRYVDHQKSFAGTPRYSLNSGLLALAAWLRRAMPQQTKVHYLDLFGEAVIGKGRVLCRPTHEYPSGDLVVTHGMTSRAFSRRLSQIDPDVVGVNCFTTAHHCDAIAACECVRKWGRRKRKHVTIIVGGVHPSALAEYFATQDCVDYVVRGEGELTFTELLKSIIAGREPSNVQGLTFRSKLTGNVVRTEDRQPLDVRRLPWLARDLVPRKRGRSALYIYDLWHQGPEGRPFDVIMRSRGCPYARRDGCRNCASARFFAKFRSRRVADCLDEVQSLVRRGVTVISDESDQVLLPTQEFMQFCRGLIERRLHKRVEFITPNGLHVGLLRQLGEEGRRLMVEAGYRDLCLAVEGTQDYVNAVLRKPVNSSDVEPVCRSFRAISDQLRKRVIIRAFVMLDGPRSTQLMAQRTLAFSKRLISAGLVDQVIPFIATPIAGSPFFDETMRHFAKKVRHSFSEIYLPGLIPKGSLDHRRDEILHRLEASDTTVIYDIFHEFRVWPAFRYGLGRVQSMTNMDGTFLEKTAQEIHDLCPNNPFRIG